jgi:hypothetical protein
LVMTSKAEMGDSSNYRQVAASTSSNVDDVRSQLYERPTTTGTARLPRFSF